MHINDPDLRSFESAWPHWVLWARYSETCGLIGLPFLASSMRVGPLAHPSLDSEWRAHLIAVLLDSAALLALALVIFWAQWENERNSRREPGSADSGALLASPILEIFVAAHLVFKFISLSGFPIPDAVNSMMKFFFLALILLSVLLLSREKRIRTGNRKTGRQRLQLPVMILVGVCLCILVWILHSPLILLIVPLALCVPRWMDKGNSDRIPEQESRTVDPGTGRSDRVFPAVHRRRLRLPEGRNPCEELARAHAGNPLGSRMILLVLAGILPIVSLFALFDDHVDLHPSSIGILILIEAVVRWSLATGIPRQYDQVRNGGTLELILGSSLSAGQVVRGLARAAWKNHLWKIGLLSFCHLLILQQTTSASRLHFHLGSLPLIWLEAHAIHMAGACLALRGCNRIRVALGLFGVYCLLPLATLFLPSLFLPVSSRTLVDASLILRTACALLGSLLFLDLRRIRRIFDDPDHRGLSGLLLPRRARTARS